MADVKIQVLENGPLLVTGAVELTDHQGNPVPVRKATIALCRCGASSTKPFCDGAHSAIGFNGAAEAVRQAEVESDAAEEAPPRGTLLPPA
ncbi:MAG TPA: CDGSH iron-sulfur domain-containing protein [Armatimonadota bacterium]|nr:CDGSH iron-sulfur domain-containing protein [Armatimonadota bacterium]